MTVAYPELNVDANLPLFGYQKRKCEEHTRREDAKSSVDDLKKNLQDSIEIEGWGEGITVNMESEEKCLEMLKKLEDAINCHRRKITYLSCLQGQVMERLLTPHSQSYAYFLIRLFDFSEKYNKIKHSTLTIRFFILNKKFVKFVKLSQNFSRCKI